MTYIEFALALRAEMTYLGFAQVPVVNNQRPKTVTPAYAGVQQTWPNKSAMLWIPAFAGMT
jgi:hypothetical protein